MPKVTAFDGGQSAPLPINSTGSLAGDVALLAGWLDRAAEDVITGGEWGVLDKQDPMGTIAQLSAYVGTLNIQLMAQGFRPPLIEYMDDPVGFLQHNAAFLAKIAPLVIEPPVTRH